MASSTFKWNDAELRKLLAGRDGAVAKDLARRAVRVESAAKRLCPVDTGRLRSSITWGLDTDGAGIYADVGTNVSYAPYVELGTRYAADQPFLEPALKAAA